jgi:hypothetical protein
LCREGALLDQYDSCPAYFEGGDSLPAGGNGGLVAETLDVPESARRVHRILHEEEFALQIERHEELARTLGLPEISVGFGYRYLERGEFPSDLTQENLIHTDR